jgi:phosphoribosylformylglycinamidine synthase
MRWGIIVFPGSNCDADAFHALNHLGFQTKYLWHKDFSFRDCDALLLPGGFSYGDYLRPGAISRFAPVMAGVAEFAEQGGLILGVCNGFQILTEAGLLPGVLLRNDSLQFRCQDQELLPEGNSLFTRYLEGPVRFPIAHGDGRYYVEEVELACLEAQGQIAFRYPPGSNPNGSAEGIAGVTNTRGNVLGLMPHPERAVEKILGGTDGARFFAGLTRAWREI